jgi:hypothetical protein
LVNPHPMTMRVKRGFRLPNDKLTLSATSSSLLSPMPTFIHAALVDLSWCRAMEEEYDALITNNTWDLVPHAIGSNVVTDKWIFKHKFNSNDTLERYNACWVLRGFTQRPDVNYDKTFSLFVKPATVHMVLSLAISCSWFVHQLDVKKTFLYGTLSETVYCSQSIAFVDPMQPDRVWCLNKSLYYLKQVPQAWYNRFATYLLTLGFVVAKSDTSLLIFRCGTDMVYLLLYVDDVVLTASSTMLLQHTISALKWEIAMKYLSPLHHFWWSPYNIRKMDSSSLSAKFALDILEHAGIVNCKPVSMPVDMQAKVSTTSGPPVADPTQFGSLIGALKYLMFTRLEITYAVQ